MLLPLHRQPSDWKARWNTWLFYAGIIALLIPLWSFRHVPSQDGPLHLYNAVLLRDYDAPDRQMFRAFFRPNPRIVPNWICPHVLTFLTRFLPADEAEKVLLSAYLILLPLSVRYALRAIRNRAGALAIAALPFVPNQYYHMGFHDFCLSLAGFFFVSGYWLKHRRNFHWRQSAALPVLLLVLYLTHLVSLLMTMPLIGLTALATLGAGHQPIREKLAKLLPVAVAPIPVLLLAASFLLERHPTPMAAPFPGGWHHRFVLLIDWMKAYQKRDLLAAAAVFALFTIVTLWLIARRRRATLRWGLSGGLAATILVYICAFLLAPDALSGGQLLLVRLASYPLFGLLLWWGSQPIGSRPFARMQFAVTAVSLAALVWMLVSQMRSEAELNRYLAEFDAIPAMIPIGSTLLPAHFEYFVPRAPGVGNAPGRPLAVTIDPFRHAEARGLAERGIIDLADHWATTDHHSVRWQPGRDPMWPEVDRVENFTGYSQRKGVRIDYLLYWSGGVSHDDLEGQLVNQQLGEQYERIYTSPTGYLELYRHR